MGDYYYIYKLSANIQILLKKKDKIREEYDAIKKEVDCCKCLFELDELTTEKKPIEIQNLIKKIDDGLFTLSLHFGISNIFQK